MKRVIYSIIISLICFSVIGCSRNTQAGDTSNTNTDNMSLDESTTEKMVSSSNKNEIESEPEELDIIKSFSPKEIYPEEVLSQLQFITDTICYKYTYKSDNETVVGYLAKPVEITEKLPIIIYNRGGNREFGKLTDETVCAVAYFFAQNGYIVLASQYRGVDGGTGLEQFGGNDVNDILNLIEIAKNLPYADSKNIFLYGESRGGMMTYAVCKNNSDIKAAVVDSGIADLYNTWEEREQGMKDVLCNLIGGSPDQLPHEYDKRSAVKWANEITVPLLILHSKEDWRVSYQQALSMIEQLEKYNKNYSFISYDDDIHGNLRRAFSEICDWFEQYRDK